MPQFRPSKKDQLRFNKLKKRTNSKLSRIKKNDGVDFSAEINVPSSINDFATRKEYNQFVERAEFFNIRNNSHYKIVTNKFGVKSTVRELSQEKVRTKIAQRRADDVMKGVLTKPIFDQGKQTNTTVGQKMLEMGKPSVGGIVRPSDFNFETYQTQAGLEGRFKSTEGRSQPNYYDKRNEKLKDNFIYVLNEAYNSDGQELIEKIRAMSNDDFFMIYTRTEEFNFEVYYLNEDNAISAPEENSVDKMLSFVNAFNEGVYDKDFKKF